MNAAVRKILEQVCGTSSIRDAKGSIDHTIAKYPSFGPAHLLKAIDEDSPELKRKAALYFSNSFWLQYLLTEDELSEEDELVEEETIVQKQEQLVTKTDKAGGFRIDISDLKESPEESPLEEEALQESEAADEFNLSGMLAKHAEEFKKPIMPEAELPIKSTPLYTIDYFASQGIHIESIKAGRDQLDTKVKRFTDWLKEMKTVNPSPIDLGTDEETEHMIETIAQNSNETKDIITEAMAEVLIKQGKISKALNLYQKLSFLNPDKSAYFAAKIEKIKAI